MKKIVFKNVSIGYDKKKNIVNNVSFYINEGDFVSIIGPNGSGKSTVLFGIFSIAKINSGTITYDNKDIKLYNKKDLSKKIAFVPQIITFPDDVTLWEFVQMGRHPYNNIFFSNKHEDDKKVTQAIKDVNLFEFKNKYINELSGGQKQRSLIALVLAQDTETIILDEPTNHLDIKSQLEIMHLLHDLNHKKNKTIILVIHDINHGLKFSDNVIIMKEGVVKLQGKTNDIITKESIEEIFGVTPKIMKSHNQKIIYDFWIKGLTKPTKYHKSDHKDKKK